MATIRSAEALALTAQVFLGDQCPAELLPPTPVTLSLSSSRLAAADGKHLVEPRVC